MGVLEQYHDVFLVLHLVGFAIGLGAATLHDVAFAQYINLFDKVRWNPRIFNMARGLIFTSLVWVSLSGVLLYAPQAALLNASAVFQTKLLVMLVLVVSSFIFHALAMPRLSEGMQMEQVQIGRARGALASRRVRQLCFVLGAVSLTSWYSAVALGALSLNVDLSLLLTAYGGLLLLTAGISLGLEQRFQARLTRSSEQTLGQVASQLLGAQQPSFFKETTPEPPIFADSLPLNARDFKALRRIKNDPAWGTQGRQRGDGGGNNPSLGNR